MIDIPEDIFSNFEMLFKQSLMNSITSAGLEPTFANCIAVLVEGLDITLQNVQDPFGRHMLVAVYQYHINQFMELNSLDKH